MDEITQKFINELHNVVAQRTEDEAYYFFEQIIAEAQSLQSECLKMMVVAFDDTDDED